MSHGDTALISLSLDRIWTLGVRIVEATGHGGGASLREVWALVVLAHQLFTHIAIRNLRKI